MTKIFDIESETALISLVLKNPDRVYEVNDLKSFMFSSTANQVIWSTVETLKEEKLIPEPTLLFSRIETEGKLSEAGGKEFLDTFLQQDFKVENIREYERSIVNNFRVKEILTLASDIQKQVKASQNVEDVLSKVKNDLAKIENFSQGSENITMLAALKDTWKDIEYSLENKGISGYSTGLEKLDLVTYGFEPGKLWVIAARPGMAKTGSQLGMALALGKQGIPTLVLSKEMRYKELVKRMIATQAGVSISDIMLGNIDQSNLDKIQDAIVEMKSYPITINDKFQAFDLVTSIRKEVSTKGTKVVFVDYLQLLSERGEDQTEELGRIVRNLKLLSVELEITIVILSQLNRLVELRQDKRPILSDIRQAGAVEEDCDIAIFLYRDELYDSKTKHPGEIEFLIRKNRMGSVGTLVFKFDAPTNKISDGEL